MRHPAAGGADTSIIKRICLWKHIRKKLFKGKVKGNYQDFYVTDLIFKKNKVEARCNCPLKEEWCKHSVAVALKAIETGAYENWMQENTEFLLIQVIQILR